MVDEIRPLSDLDTLVQSEGEEPRRNPKTLWVKLPSRYDPIIKKIELILTMFPVNQKMIIWCEREKKKIGTNCLIHDGLVMELEEMLGKENVVIK